MRLRAKGVRGRGQVSRSLRFMGWKGITPGCDTKVHVVKVILAGKNELFIVLVLDLGHTLACTLSMRDQLDYNRASLLLVECVVVPMPRI